MYLLDTVVVSEGGKRRPAPEVVAWLDRQNPAALYLSFVTLGEIAHGIAKVHPFDPAFSRRLTEWLTRLREDYADRVLPLTLDIALRWGQLCAAVGNKNVDLMIAATALASDLTVVTRNRRHFEETGVKLFDPFDS